MLTVKHFPLTMKQMKGCEIMKALASDFDGTLYLHDAAESYREGDIAGIGQLQKQGCLFGLCTGRPLWGIYSIFFLSDCILILYRKQRSNDTGQKSKDIV